jgi:diguanylate cyclase (GGDEF)-like protein
MLDVDHFEAFNDTHGHPQADVALQQGASVIASCVRTTDTAYQLWGRGVLHLVAREKGQLLVGGIVFDQQQYLVHVSRPAARGYKVK